MCVATVLTPFHWLIFVSSACPIFPNFVVVKFTGTYKEDQLSFILKVKHQKKSQDTHRKIEEGKKRETKGLPFLERSFVTDFMWKQADFMWNPLKSARFHENQLFATKWGLASSIGLSKKKPRKNNND